LSEEVDLMADSVLKRITALLKRVNDEESIAFLNGVSNILVASIVSKDVSKKQNYLQWAKILIQRGIK
jgi:hypothetical protein